MKLNKEDLNKCVGKMPPVISDLIRRGFYIGGGFIRSVLNKEEIADYDIFGKNTKEINDVVQELKLIYFAEKIYVGNTYNAYTIKIKNQKPIQFITKWLFDSPEACMRSFDYAICRAVIFWDKDKQEFDSVVDPDFYYSLNFKKLIYCNPVREEIAAGSFLRMQKFILKGYPINHENLAKVTARMLAGMAQLPKFSSAKTESDFVEHTMELFEQSTVDFRGNY